MTSNRKDQICTLLKGIETGDPQSVTVVNESKYVQHNPLTREGNVGLAELFKRLSETSPRVNIVRIFEDGDYVFAHTDYDFNVVEIGFEVFRFDDVLVCGHLDRLDRYVDSEGYTEHNPDIVDGLPALRASLSSNTKVKTYDKLHRVLAEGSFVLSVGECSLDAVHSSFFRPS